MLLDGLQIPCSTIKLNSSLANFNFSGDNLREVEAIDGPFVIILLRPRVDIDNTRTRATQTALAYRDVND